MDREDRVMMDVPLFIRILELVREDIKDDAGLHVVADAIITQSRGGKVLDMQDYSTILQNVKRAVQQNRGPQSDADVDDIRRRAGI